MATIDSLRQSLQQKATEAASSSKQPLPDALRSAGADILRHGSAWTTIQEFIVPQLLKLSSPILRHRRDVRVLEINPGPKSVLGFLPRHWRRGIAAYSAYEPNALFATQLEEWLRPASEMESPMPGLMFPPRVFRVPFDMDCIKQYGEDLMGHFDIILFGHGIYNMNPRREYIEGALRMLKCDSGPTLLVVIHHDEILHFDGLVCHRTDFFPNGSIGVENNDEVLDSFSAFVAGFTMLEADVDVPIRAGWRELCRTLGRREDAYPNRLCFSSPYMMVTFTRHATGLCDLIKHVPLLSEDSMVRSREGRTHRPAGIVRPEDNEQVGHCIRWALKHETGLTIIGGGHSGHSIWPNVVAVDMSHCGVEIYKDSDRKEVFAGTGCTTGDIIGKAMAAGLTVPLGTRPGVGAGSWLQGGIGYMARTHGLACDAIVGATIVSLDSGQVLHVGKMPNQEKILDAKHTKIDADLLWALKGGGTNFGIVSDVVFEAYTAPTYEVRNWAVPMGDRSEVRLKLADFDDIAKKLPRNSSISGYLYWEADEMHLGVAMFRSREGKSALETTISIDAALGMAQDIKTVDGGELFKTEMYMSGKYGGQGEGRTSSFKRCVFLKHIGDAEITDVLVAAVKTRPSPLCYIHLIQGGGAVSDVAADATAFGCRDWDFACVITGVWPCNEGRTQMASQAATQWVYDVARDLLPLSRGAYGADLGPDPRDAALAARAFGPNLRRLTRLKRRFDPGNVLAYACPLKEPVTHKLIILVTGESCTGKDYCAQFWASFFIACTKENLTAHVVSISDDTKREYASATGADLDRLLRDRAYKEQHRPALTAFFQDQVRRRPRLPEEHFLNAVGRAGDADVLLITGMRDEAPVPSFWPLVPDRKLLEVRVIAEPNPWQGSRRFHDKDDDSENRSNGGSNLTALDYRPSFVFNNNITGPDGEDRMEMFAQNHLLPFFHDDLQQLADMVPFVPDFPRPGINFRHVLNIAQHPGGLALCTSLLRGGFFYQWTISIDWTKVGDWTRVGALVSCETGGFVFASALAARLKLPLVLVRKAGKLPSPTVSVTKSSSHISSPGSNESKEEQIEIDRDAIPRDTTVVVVDDVLATGKTLCAVFQLLIEAGVGAKNIGAMAVAEFPVHRGREMLYRRGFGGISIQSLLIYGGA
ncbi:phosphoribosyl transferase domain protein [Annulohypoxylon maeteangense]|uniref:phosphoribosyl transferase domain protein n=1 Tax=Annulohypoxylon maeteangense TaxID=1927788 RepID=UPI0020081D44|nr:phosphoribosyl transferase domain protein [Annulohypoxylon maeteangense]KAI0882829.1 phosphoribosyl transferase domain protein [Annulohypoxylon maeteangense]